MTTAKSRKSTATKKAAKAPKKAEFKNSVKGKESTPSGQNQIKVMATVIVLQSVIIAILVLVLVMQSKVSTPVAANTAQKTTTTTQSEPSGPKQHASIIPASEENGGIGDHVIGKQDSDVVAVIYYDMQCPACARIMPTMKAIYEQYGDRVAFVFRYYVITGHDYARAASIAVEAAAKQGYYWEMMNMTFDKRSDWAYANSESMLEDRLVEVFEAASGGNGDVAQFRADLKDDNLAKKVDFDWNTGVKDSISATPTIIVNGEEVDFTSGSKGIIETITDALDSALK